ncbi:MAG: hypothetical protein KC419_03640 [Anaerolineales bacterium]|nr:hypothetical protein [Anaerolineales bacterium]MCA9927539.1 hypothetical protein [Anaerolineales bacterium]
MMHKQTHILFFLLIFSVLSAACSGDGTALPTAASAAQIPSPAPPTATILPPTLDLTATNMASQSTTLPPTNTRTDPTPTTANAVINITVPDTGAELTMGESLRVFGLVQKNEGENVWVSLKSSNGRLLVEQQAQINEIGWETTIPIPNQVSGAALLQAGIRDEAGILQNLYQQPVRLVPNRDIESRFLILNRPEVDETAVSGFNIFFDGELKGAAGNQVTISLWADKCRTRIARQSFVLGASSQSFYWQGFVIAPRNVAGPACAVASFGEPGDSNWREAVVPINILATDDRDAKGIRISNPRPNTEIEAGTEMFINGTALNVAADEILVSILLENGRIVSQTNVNTDYWGYFELTVLIPFDIVGPAQIIAEYGEGDSFADGIGDIIIVPPPTPTPIP